MKSSGKFVLSFALAGIIFFCIGCTVPENRNKAEKVLPALDYLDRKISSWVDSGYYDGAAVMVVKNKDQFFESYYGNYTDTTALNVVSAGKWIAAAVIAGVVDEGKLSWDAKVNQYLPEFTDLKGEATIRQLLSHTAGFPNYQPSGRRRDDYQTLKEAVANIVDLLADTMPGSKYHYGGLAMQVAGRMAEVATGKDWEMLFQEKIAIPLDMQHSFFVPVSEEPGFNPMLAGGFKTCLKDYINFLNMFSAYGVYNGVQVLSKASVEEIESDHIRNAYYKPPEYVVDVRQNYHKGIYGLGVSREEVDANGKATIISSPGWAGTYPWIDRKNNIYGCIIAKVNVHKANCEGFSSFYGSTVLPLIIRDAVTQTQYPSQLKKTFLDIGDAMLYYEEMGEGEPVIFVHGHSLNHRMWDSQFFEFAKEFRAIRYDIRGYGYSSPQDEINQFTHVEDLVKLMDELGLEKAHIIGLSLGGYIGADMLGWFPDRILSAVLASGNVRPDPRPGIRMDLAEFEIRDQEIEALKRKGVDVMKREWFNGLMQSAGTEKSRLRKPLWNMIHQWDAWQPLHKEVRVIAGGDAYDKLKQNKPLIPVLVLEGRSENNSFPDNPEILQYLPNGRLVVIDNCGHMLNMENPGAFNETVLNFIQNK